MIWEDAKHYVKEDDDVKQLIERLGDIDSFILPDDYYKLWEDVSKGVQVKKAQENNLSPAEAEESFKKLCRRPYYLTTIAKEFGVKNIAEVGTAQGLQFYSFAKYVDENHSNSGHVWSCDIIDARNKEYSQKYNHLTTFCLGTSEHLASVLEQSNTSIDLFYIDASHQQGAVLNDIRMMKRFQHEDTVWVFDDFDLRFGCYEDIKFLCKLNKKFKIYSVGNTASGKPNHQVVIFGKL